MCESNKLGPHSASAVGGAGGDAEDAKKRALRKDGRRYDLTNEAGVNPAMSGDEPSSSDAAGRRRRREEAPVITYQRRARSGAQKKRKLCGGRLGDLEGPLREGGGGSDWRSEEGSGDPATPSTLENKKVRGEEEEQEEYFVPGKVSRTRGSWIVPIGGHKKTVAPKRVIGQYFLDLGQSDFSYSTCRLCGLFYARGQHNDEKVHKSFHRNFVHGIQFKGWQRERVVTRLNPKGSRVVLVVSGDRHHQTKVREVIGVMEVELGLTAGWLLQRACKVYLFISSSKKVVGCVMAEPIKAAFRVVPAEVPFCERTPCEDSSSRVSGEDAGRCQKQVKSNILQFGNMRFIRETAPRKRKSTEDTRDLGRAILHSKIPEPAACGIRVIWVSHSERRKGIASHLLDAVRKSFCLGLVLEHSQIAFSQPTPEGKRFAEHYCRTREFLVYSSS